LTCPFFLLMSLEIYLHFFNVETTGGSSSYSSISCQILKFARLSVVSLQILHSITPLFAFFTPNIALNYTLFRFFHPQHCTQLHPFSLFSPTTLHSITPFLAFFTYNIALIYTLFSFFHPQHCTQLHPFSLFSPTALHSFTLFFILL